MKHIFNYIADWREDKPTASQRLYIEHLRKECNSPPFDGSTKGDAAKYIEKYKKGNKKYIEKYKTGKDSL